MASESDLFQAAVQVHRRGELEHAANLYQQVIAAAPGHSQAFHLWSVIAWQTQQLPLALELVDRAIQLDSSQASFYATLGEIHRAANRLSSAQAACAAAVSLAPSNPKYHCQLASVLREMGEMDAARAHLRAAIGVQPNFSRAHFLAGNLEASCGCWAAAIVAYERALECQPNFAAAEARLAVALETSGGSGAMKHFQRAVELEPHSAEHQFNWGVALSRQGRDEESAETLVKTLELNPRHVDALVNLGGYYQERGNEEQALAAYDRALAIDPAAAEAYYNRSLIRLGRGEFSAGWADYDWRRRIDGFPVRSVERPMWDGSPLPNQTLLIHAEQGLGDTLHFVRYLPLAQARAQRAVLLAPLPLIPLLANSGFQDVIGTEAELPAFDYQVPLMSLPGLLDPTLANILGHVPYLRPSPVLIARWREPIESRRGLRIGIAWQGSPTHKGDRRRSIPLAAFAPLLELDGLQLISLQKSAGAEQISAAPFPVHQLEGDWDQAAGAFMDSAAVMRHLDLVITADTAIAHLAGAIAKPVWIALSHHPDWRWQTAGDRTPWYPTARLFRQPHPGDWQGVFEAMAGALLSEHYAK